MAGSIVNFHPDFGVKINIRFIPRKINPATQKIDNYLEEFTIDGNDLPNRKKVSLLPPGADDYKICPIPPLFAVHVISGPSGCGKTVFARDIAQVMRDDDVLTSNSLPPMSEKTLNLMEEKTTSNKFFKDDQPKTAIYFIMSAKFNDKTLAFADDQLDLHFIQLHTDKYQTSIAEAVRSTVDVVRRYVTLNGSASIKDLPNHIRLGCYWQTGFKPSPEQKDDSQWNGCFHSPPCGVMEGISPDTNITRSAVNIPIAEKRKYGLDEDSEEENSGEENDDLSRPSHKKMKSPPEEFTKILPPIYHKGFRNSYKDPKQGAKFTKKEQDRLGDLLDDHLFEERGELLDRENAEIDDMEDKKQKLLQKLVRQFLFKHPEMVDLMAANHKLDSNKTREHAKQLGIEEQFKILLSSVQRINQKCEAYLKNRFTAEKDFLLSQEEINDKSKKKLDKNRLAEKMKNNGVNLHLKKKSQRKLQEKTIPTTDREKYIKFTRVFLLFDDFDYGDKKTKTHIMHTIKEFCQKGRADNFFIALVAHNIQDPALGGIKNEITYLTTFPMFNVDDGIRRYMEGRGYSSDGATQVMRYLTEDPTPYATIITIGQPFMVTGTHAFRVTPEYKEKPKNDVLTMEEDEENKAQITDEL